MEILTKLFKLKIISKKLLVIEEDKECKFLEEFNHLENE